MDFLSEPLILLLGSYALRIYNTIILLLFLTYEAHRRKFRKILNEARVKVAMKPVHTMNGILPSPEDPDTLEEKSCLVYQVPSFDCNFVYIGQTKRNLKFRLTEHKLVIKNQELEKPALCKHSIDLIIY